MGAEQLRIRLRRVNTRYKSCGDCQHWMKTSSCPFEAKRKPTIDTPACDSFLLKDGIEINECAKHGKHHDIQGGCPMCKAEKETKGEVRGRNWREAMVMTLKEELAADECPRCKPRAQDACRLDLLQDMLMQADCDVSEKLGLPKGWVDLRDALDRIVEERGIDFDE